MIVVNCRGRRRRRVVVLSCLSSFFSSVWTFVTLLSLTALLFGQKQPDTFSYKATAFVIPTITPTIQRSMSSSSSSCRRIPRPANLVTPSASSSMTFRTPHHKNSQPYNLYNSPQPFVQHEPYTVEELASQKALSQRWKKSTKQVATLGPASCTLEMIEALFLAGADMFRLNFSHGTQEEKLDLLHLIRQVEQKYSHPIAVMGDLQGPKLRVRMYILLGSFVPSFLGLFFRSFLGQTMRDQHICPPFFFAFLSKRCPSILNSTLSPTSLFSLDFCNIYLCFCSTLTHIIPFYISFFCLYTPTFPST